MTHSQINPFLVCKGLRTKDLRQTTLSNKANGPNPPRAWTARIKHHRAVVAVQWTGYGLSSIVAFTHRWPDGRETWIHRAAGEVGPSQRVALDNHLSRMIKEFIIHNSHGDHCPMSGWGDWTPGVPQNREGL